MSNFTFLENEFPILCNLAQGAEYNLYQDPITSLIKLRQFIERLVDTLYKKHFLEFPYENSLARKIKKLEYEGILPDKLRDLFFAITKKGNIAAHQIKGTTNDATSSLLTSFKIAKWFYEIYSGELKDVSELRFSKPPNLDARQALTQLEKNYAELEDKFNQLLKGRDTSGLESGVSKQIKEKAHRLARKIDMSEAETREIIDQQLRDAGWIADTEKYNHKKFKTLPERGKTMAIAEWKVGSKWADYALFIGTELFGIVEAKKYAADISTNLHQSKIYAELAESGEGFQCIGKWRNYKVPFLFSTNGRKYLEQLATKSGIWFLDVRKDRNNAKALQGWYSPEGLEKLLRQNLVAAEQKLKDRSLDFLTKPTGLGLRDYQLDAIKATENMLLHNPDRRRGLIAMATGTGKTRTIIGLSYRFISSNRFKRILFLVDRRMLANQAYDAFQDNKIENILTFSDAYKMDGLKNIIPDIDTRLHFATVQSLVNRLFYPTEDQPMLPIDTYDCIIVDEAHRGYLLDREMDDEELLFKNEKQFVSMYRMVIDYFDAFTLGLTATPALHTTEIFGKPIYTYSYREAVIDGWLIDHNPPIKIKTEQSENGIVWEVGEKPKVYDRENNQIIELDELEDELKIEVAQFNKEVIAPSFNKTVISYLVQQLDPEGMEKTLVFASNDEHADLIVKTFFEEFRSIRIDVPDEAIVKITGKAYNPDLLLKRFKNEKYPTIVVTVDLLTTGIDVPAICNLVFMRRVRSRILYEQMLGRATRRCDDIGKEVFQIYDAVRMYEALEDLTNMKPVTINPSATLEQLATEIKSIEGENRIRKQIEQIIAQLQRKKKYINEENIDKFLYHTEGLSPDDFIERMKTQYGSEGKNFVDQFRNLWPFIDDLKPPKRYQLISEQEDTLLDAEIMYHGYKKPEDYIEGFTQYINKNRNKIAALNIICTRPTSLDRNSLKSLILELDANGFNSNMLNKAWKQSKNVDITADIISYIRSLALGTDLEDHDTRIKRAMDRIRKMKDWNAVQKKWLDRFEKQLLAESVIQMEDLDREPFQQAGGYKRLNKIFNQELDTILQSINKNLYQEIA